MRKAIREEKKSWPSPILKVQRKFFFEVERKKTKAIMDPRNTILVGVEDLSGKGGAVASGLTLFHQLGGWHLNLNCWGSSGGGGVCVGVCVFMSLLIYSLDH